jgi:hypothetical protein
MSKKTCCAKKNNNHLTLPYPKILYFCMVEISRQFDANDNEIGTVGGASLQGWTQKTLRGVSV